MGFLPEDTFFPTYHLVLFFQNPKDNSKNLDFHHIFHMFYLLDFYISIRACSLPFFILSKYNKKTPICQAQKGVNFETDDYPNKKSPNLSKNVGLDCSSTRPS